MKTCNICAEECFEGHFISCPISSCEHECCFACIQKYIETQTGSISCMNCKAPWSQTFMYRNLPRAIVFKTMKTQRTNMLFEREKSLLPHTQKVVEMMNKRKDILNEISRYKTMIEDLKYNLRILDIEISGGLVETPEKRRTILMGCPSTNCRGFVFSDTFSCGMCNTSVCKTCHVISEKDHTCKNEDIETVKMLKRETKPCPGCGAPSRKTDGCDQVWCYNCHNAWSWQRGVIEEGIVHALDYFTYMRNNNREIPRYDRCRENNIGNYHNVIERHMRNKVITPLEADILNANFRNMGENQHVTEPHLPNFEELRMMYLNKELDEDNWKKRIIRRDKDYVFKMECYNMRRSYFTTMRDMFSEFCLQKKTDKVREKMREINVFRKMMVHEFANLCVAFKSNCSNPFN